MDIVEVFGSVEEVQLIISGMRAELERLREEREVYVRLGKTSVVNRLSVQIGDKDQAIKKFDAMLAEHLEGK